MAVEKRCHLRQTLVNRENDAILSSGCNVRVIRMRFGFALALVLLTSEAGAAELDASEIRSEIVGQTIEWWENGGWHSGSLTLLPDGRAAISVERPKPSSEDGRWTIRGNMICTAWDAIRGGEEKCYSLRRTGNDRFETSGGNVFRIVTAGA